MAFLPSMIVSSLASWLVASSLWIYPHSLSYFNESIGGPLSGAKHLLGSNVDWGQDFRYLNWSIVDLQKKNKRGLAYKCVRKSELIGIAFPDEATTRAGIGKFIKKGSGPLIGLTEHFIAEVKSGEAYQKPLDDFRYRYKIASCGYTIEIFQLPTNSEVRINQLRDTMCLRTLPK